MLKYSLLFMCMITCYCTQAQVKKKIKKGRRNKPESQFMLDKNYLELDWEIGHETLTNDLSTTVYPNLVVRYALSKRLEINAEINFITATDKTAQHRNTTGTEPVLLGADYLLVGEGRERPAIILSAQLAIPFIASKNFRANYLAPLLQVNFQKPINQRFTVGISAGAFWDGFLPAASFIYNTTVSYTVAKKWMITSESFGFINASPPLHNTDISINYAFNKKVQFGFTAGTGISTAAHKNYIAVNGIWGCNLKRKK